MLVSRTALGPAKSPESAASGAELLYLPPAAGDSSGALLASTRKSTPAGQADDLLWLPLSEDGAVVANELQRVSPTRGQSLRGATVTADGLYLFVAGQASPFWLLLSLSLYADTHCRWTALSLDRRLPHRLGPERCRSLAGSRAASHRPRPADVGACRRVIRMRGLGWASFSIFSLLR